jgi:hypothetical protein
MMEKNEIKTAELDKPFPCLICGKLLEAASMSDQINAKTVIDGYGVWDGIPFETSGAYGSRILDCSGKIYFAICDVCLLQRRHRFLGIDYYDKEIEGGIHNGIKMYENWLKYIEDQGDKSYWDKIKDGVDLID